MASGWVTKIERCTCTRCGWTGTRAKPKAKCPSPACDALASEITVGHKPVSWRAEYRDPSGRKRSSTFKAKAEAEAKLAKVATSIGERTWSDPDLGKVRFGDYFERLLVSEDFAESTRVMYGIVFRLHIEPAFGHTELRAISSKAIREHVGVLKSRGVGARTQQLARAIISRTLARAVEDGILANNPATYRAKRKRGSGPVRKPVRVPTASEVEAIAEVVSDRYRAMILTAAYGALRFGEVAGLRPRDLRLLERKLVVDGSVVQVGGHVSRQDSTKTPGSRRTVSIPAFLSEELAAHLARYPVPDPDGLVFTAPMGGLLGRSVFRTRVWVPAIQAAGIDPPPTFHSLRHCGVALAIKAGAHPQTIRAWVGHSNITTTLNTYGHLYKELEEELAEGLDAIRAKTLEQAAEQGTNGTVVALGARG